jgi:5-methylthioadenosine/S-adenosylhomocysteine deaminase
MAEAYDARIVHGTVVTVNGSFEVVEDALLCIADGRVGRLEKMPDASDLPAAVETLDARGCLILPGLVNAHTHLPMTLFRGLADDLPLQRWLEEHIFPAENRHVAPETVRIGTLAACAELLLSGVTTCCDGYFLEDEVAEAVRQTGLRAVLGQGVIDFPAPGVPDASRNIDTARSFLDRWSGRTPLVQPSVFCHSPYTCSDGTLRRAKELAVEYGTLLQIHLAETRTEREQCLSTHGVSPVEHLDRLGLLDPGTLLVHAVWVDEEDIRRIADTGCAVVHCPESNMKLASGIAPVPEMLSRGIPVAIGTDGSASNNDLDLLREMDTAAKLHKARLGDPTTMEANAVVRMATAEGARAIGWASRIGTLEIGKAADLVVLDTRRPSMTPMYRPSSHLVYVADGSAVRDVMVAGRFLVRNGCLASFSWDAVREEMGRIASRIAPVCKPGRMW